VNPKRRTSIFQTCQKNRIVKADRCLTVFALVKRYYVLASSDSEALKRKRAAESGGPGGDHQPGILPFVLMIPLLPPLSIAFHKNKCMCPASWDISQTWLDHTIVPGGMVPECIVG